MSFNDNSAIINWSFCNSLYSLGVFYAIFVLAYYEGKNLAIDYNASLLCLVFMNHQMVWILIGI